MGIQTEKHEADSWGDEATRHSRHGDSE